MEVSGQIYTPAILFQGNIPHRHCVGSSFDPRADIDVVEDNLLLYLEMESRALCCQVRRLVAIPTELSRLPQTCVLGINLG
jgi:hypothetical protein